MKKTKRAYRKMNAQAKQALYIVRQRKGDSNRLSEMTGYSQGHVCNVIAGRRSTNENIGNAMYSISRRREIVA